MDSGNSVHGRRSGTPRLSIMTHGTAPFYYVIFLHQSYVISKLYACTFVTCSLNVIDWSSHEDFLAAVLSQLWNQIKLQQYIIIRRQINVVYAYQV